uniref:Uncharacterized protein n=1 Tax=Physcomitrium patens TaxID=3218 RepID=A0A2K1IVU3_PHYPA|nr:hypothetical protein PHYPA_025340 [Physcomitrium patens]
MASCSQKKMRNPANLENQPVDIFKPWYSITRFR